MKRYRGGPGKTSRRMARRLPGNSGTSVVVSYDVQDVVVSSGVSLFNYLISPTINQVVTANTCATHLANAYQYVKISKVQVILDPQINVFDGLVGVGGLAQGHFAHRIATSVIHSGYDTSPTQIEAIPDCVGGQIHRPNVQIKRDFLPYVMSPEMVAPAGAFRSAYQRAPWFGTTNAQQGGDVVHYCGNVTVEPPGLAGGVASTTQVYKVRLRVELRFRKPRGG